MHLSSASQVHMLRLKNVAWAQARQNQHHVHSGERIWNPAPLVAPPKITSWVCLAFLITGISLLLALADVYGNILLSRIISFLHKHASQHFLRGIVDSERFGDRCAMMNELGRWEIDFQKRSFCILLLHLYNQCPNQQKQQRILQSWVCQITTVSPAAQRKLSGGMNSNAWQKKHSSCRWLNWGLLQSLADSFHSSQHNRRSSHDFGPNLQCLHDHIDAIGSHYVLLADS